MAGNLRFQINLITAGNVLPEVEARAKDLRPAFEEIIDQWAQTNEDKFALSRGAEMTGAEIDPGVFWTALKPGTIKAKRKAGFANQIMVATGALRGEMTDPEGFFRETAATEAAFGTPKDDLNEQKLKSNNKLGRQVIFLSVDDQRMIDKNVKNYLSLGENFKEILFQKGLDASARRSEIAEMNANFEGTVG